MDALICGEDAAAAQFLAAVLESRGFSVETVPHVSQAIPACLRGEYKMAVVSLDRRAWPSCSGELFEPFRVLHQVAPSMPLVVVCEEGGLEVESRLREEGVFYFLTKPFAAGELSAAVECAIRKSEKQRQSSSPDQDFTLSDASGTEKIP